MMVETKSTDVGHISSSIKYGPAVNHVNAPIDCNFLDSKCDTLNPPNVNGILSNYKRVYVVDEWSLATKSCFSKPDS